MEAIAVAWGFNPDGGTNNTANDLEHVSLEETEHYAVARRFLNDPRGQIERVLAADQER